MLRVSVVVSSYERPEGLARLIDALTRQTLDPGAFEVVVVDNGSGPATAAALASVEAANLRHIRHARTRGPAGGRNSGWRLAAAPLIAFTDDDCVPAPDWLAELLAAADAHPGAIIQGAIVADPVGLAATGSRLWTRVVEVAAADGRYETANILYPRALLRELGGFDEGFGLRPAGEDTDLGWVAREHGVGTVFAPAAVVEHDVVVLGPRGALGNATRWAACARLFKRHPAARREILTHYVFWDVWHYLLWRSLFALAAPPWLRRVILNRHLAALRHRARDLNARPYAIAYLLLEDATGSAAMLAAGIRERTPLL